jgi:GDPmannose 4,6-dehydratase
VNLLIGDPTKAKTKLNWQPKYTLAEMILKIMKADVELFKREQLLVKSGLLSVIQT